MWADKKEYEAALRQINLRLEALAAKAAAAEGGGNMVYTTAASHTHSGGGAYETVLNIAATHSGQAQIFLINGSATGYHDLQVTVDGTVVLADVRNKLASYSGDIAYGGIWNFNISLKIEHKSDKNTSICKVAYCSV